MKLVIDIENTIDYPYEDSPKEKDGSPFNPNNKLVSVGIQNVDSNEQYYFFVNHDEIDEDTRVQSHTNIQEILNQATLLIGHNVKHDIVWLRQSGFNIPDVSLYDTMFFEYVTARSRKLDLSLDGCVARHKLSKEGKLDTLKKYMDDGVSIASIPIRELEVYGRQDVDITARLYQYQRQAVANDTTGKLQYMDKAVQLMNDFLPVVIEMYESGAAVDTYLLQELQCSLDEERRSLERNLKDIVQKLMGDKPYNLNSADDLCAILYSRKVRSKQQWAEMFNIGSEMRGNVRKQKRVNILPVNKFNRIVNDMIKVSKTKAEKCKTCDGKGYIFKLTKTGVPYKKHPKCPVCEGTGINYVNTGEIAGLKLKPKNKYVTAAGFASNKEIIEAYANDPNVPDTAMEFITKLNRYNKLCTWVDTFIASLLKYPHGTLLHTNFNQTITATGRLSSSRPNMQNQPKRDPSFVIRKVFKSRWDGGKIIDADFGQLEFRIAALLAQCSAAIQAIKDGIDIHSMTRDFYHGKLEYKPSVLQPNMTRQEAKADTFGPLYGKQTEWTKQFYALFPGIAAWHDRLMEEAVTTKEIRTPSGRIYAFPECQRYMKRDGSLSVSGHTQIKNYPVQGFATGDIVLLVMIDIHQYLRKHNAQSCIILQVHDSATTDSHPDEIQLVVDAYQYAFKNVYTHAKERFGIDINVPLAFDLTIGDNWLDQEEFKNTA